MNKNARHLVGKDHLEQNRVALPPETGAFA
jgi:hypothetical protein